MKKIIFLFFLGILTIWSCQKDNIDESTNTTNPNPPTIITTSIGTVAGLVFDENGDALADAFVQLGNLQTNSNEYGLFLFENAELNSQATYLTVQKEGYFLGSRTFVPTDNARQNVRIQLLKKTQVGNFQTAQSATITVESGTNIQFSANGIMDAEGNPYDGEVLVFAQRLDPLAENLSDIMPGNLTGLNANNQRVALSSFGMLTVELESPDGTSLQLAEGTTASIEYAVPNELLANAPATIPLWHFDEENGIWVEEGEATLQGNAYVGTVAHFSNWNWDIPYDKLINLSGTIVNKDLIGLPGLTISITLVDKWTGGYTITDENGAFTAPLPAGEIFNILVSFQEECDEPFILFEEQIGPFADDIQVPEIVVDLATIEGIVSTFEVSGSLTDCDGNPITALVQLSNENGQFIQSFLSDANGTFNQAIVSCIPVSNVIANVINLNNLEATTSSPQAFSEAINLGPLTVCNGTVAEGFLVNYASTNIYFPDGDTSHKDARFEYVECANKYFFEASWSEEFELIGFIGESDEAIVTGSVIMGESLIVNGIPTAIEITFTSVTSDRAAGTFFYTSDPSVEGAFSVPLNN